MLSLVEITAFRLESNFPPTRALEFARDHVTFKLSYDFSYQMKTPMSSLKVRSQSTFTVEHDVNFYKVETVNNGV